MFQRIITSALVIGSITLAQGAAAGSCAARDDVVERLETKFSERLTAGGLQATRPTETMVEVWASPETGTFTVLMTNPNGTSCIVAAGTDFFSDPAVLAPVASKS